MEPRKARPFIRWPGGKSSLAKKIIKLFPANYSHYYEPFLGGGAIFFNIVDDIETANLSDVNAELVNV